MDDYGNELWKAGVGMDCKKKKYKPLWTEPALQTVAFGLVKRGLYNLYFAI